MFSFPVKPKKIKIKTKNDLLKVVDSQRNRFTIGSTVPGYICKADLQIIEYSAIKLLNTAKNYPHKIYLPKPGCGAGGLKWDNVKPVIEDILKDDKYVICDFKLKNN